MSQHFLLSAAARSLSIGKVMRMSDQGVMREVSQNPTPSGSRKKMRLLRKRTSRPSLTQNREIGHFLLLNAASQSK